MGVYAVYSPEFPVNIDSAMLINPPLATTAPPQVGLLSSALTELFRNWHPAMLSVLPESCGFDHQVIVRRVRFR